MQYKTSMQYNTDLFIKASNLSKFPSQPADCHAMAKRTASICASDEGYPSDPLFDRLYILDSLKLRHACFCLALLVVILCLT